MSIFASRLIGGLFVMVLILIVKVSLAATVPDIVELGSLEHLYVKVKFNHTEHVAIAGNCAACHHHSTGTSEQDPACTRCHKNSGPVEVVSCSGCHAARPFSAASMREKSKTDFHKDMLGLKGAYHQGCTGCHSKMGGPTGCQDCHALKREGDAFYRTGPYAPPARSMKEGHKGR